MSDLLPSPLDREPEQPESRKAVIGAISLRNLEELRLRLLPDLEHLALGSAEPAADALTDLLARHRREWIDRAYPPERLPHRILLSNLAAFVATAVDQTASANGLEAATRLWDRWFEDPHSPLRRRVRLCGSAEGGGKFIHFRRTTCCLRDEVPGTLRCASCPLRRNEPAGTGRPS